MLNIGQMYIYGNKLEVLVMRYEMMLGLPYYTYSADALEALTLEA